MSTSIEPQSKPKRNVLAIASLVLGALSVAFAQFCSVPGVISIVGCFGALVAIAAATTGVFGILEARKLAGQGQRLAIGGIVTAVISLLIVLVVFIPAMLTPGGVLAHVAATPTPTITPTPTMTPTPLPIPTEPSTPLSTPAPQIHTGETFSIAFSDEWEIYESGSESTSEYLIIQHPKSGILLQIYRFTLTEMPDLEAEIEAFMAGNFGTAGPVIEEEIEIGGRQGFTGRFVLQSSQGQSHVLFAAVANGYDIYFFLAFAPTEEVLTGYEAETETIITSTQFADSPAAGPTPTPSTGPLPTTPQTYQDDKISLTYPGDWLTLDVSGDELCDQPHVTCLVLVHAEDNIQLILLRETQEDEPDLKKADRERWERLSSFSTLLSMDETEIDGRPGIERSLIQEDSTSPTGQYYALQVMFVDGYDQYTVVASASTADTMMRYQAIVEDIIASIKFIE
ncbi:MAG: DUF4190 domain-containing protein [Anaerolineae bacterium]|nr:DUF4190 domain-containing protein [Anaerolineae bacterium]